MRVGIVGAGFAGLASGLRLAQAGVKVEIFESSEVAGGLTSGFKLRNWQWPVERFYHHIFANDSSIIKLAHEVNWPAIFYRPKTCIYYNKAIFPFDNAKDFLNFPHLSLLEKLRMGIALSFLKINPFWKPLEKYSCDEFLNYCMGSGYEKIWQPLLKAKFGPYVNDVNAAWFWARIKKRTAKLGYFKGGYQGLADRLVKAISDGGGNVFFQCPVAEIKLMNSSLSVTSKLGNKRYDTVFVTTNTQLFLKITRGLPEEYRLRLAAQQSLDALNVVFILKKSLMNSLYWLNVLNLDYPFVILAEHTNMINPLYYGGQHILYAGAYLPADHKHLKFSEKEVIQLASNQLQSMFPNFQAEDIIRCFVFRGRQVQPIVTRNYSEQLPDMETPIKNLFLGNLSMVYPWDRGTNYAVEMGERIAKLILRR